MTNSIEGDVAEGKGLERLANLGLNYTSGNRMELWASYCVWIVPALGNILINIIQANSETFQMVSQIPNPAVIDNQTADACQ